jgi:hypothetical protein
MPLQRLGSVLFWVSHSLRPTTGLRRRRLRSRAVDGDCASYLDGLNFQLVGPSPLPNVTNHAVWRRRLPIATR